MFESCRVQIKIINKIKGLRESLNSSQVFFLSEFLKFFRIIRKSHFHLEIKYGFFDLVEIPLFSSFIGDNEQLLIRVCMLVMKL